jgi:hypothetical protein
VPHHTPRRTAACSNAACAARSSSSCTVHAHTPAPAFQRLPRACVARTRSRLLRPSRDAPVPVRPHPARASPASASARAAHICAAAWSRVRCLPLGAARARAPAHGRASPADLRQVQRPPAAQPAPSRSRPLRLLARCSSAARRSGRAAPAPTVALGSPCCLLGPAKEREREAGKRSAAWWKRKKGDAREDKRQTEREEGKQRKRRNGIPPRTCA